MKSALSVIDRINAKVDKSAGPEGCWMWLGGLGQKGQPTTSIGKKHATPRRLVWEHAHGEPVPSNRQVATTCKVPACLNPAHLCLRPWMDDATRFWSRVKKAEGDACWEWQGAFFASGYAVLHMVVDGVKKTRQAHRVSYEIANGVKLTASQIVMHSCDNPPCVNPAHLSVGTHADNVHDAINKGRFSRGAKHAAACIAARQRTGT